MSKMRVTILNGRLVVNSIDLHGELEIQVSHDKWIKDVFDIYQFRLRHDFTNVKGVEGYLLYVDAAGSIAFQEQTQRVRDIWRFLMWFKNTYYKRINWVLVRLNEIGRIGGN